MKKVLFLLAFLLPTLAFTSCSDDDDSGGFYKQALSGLWEEYPQSGGETTYILLNIDMTARQWVMDGEGRVTDDKTLEWEADKNFITLIYEDEFMLKQRYELNNGLLSFETTGEVFKKL